MLSRAACTYEKAPRPPEPNHRVAIGYVSLLDASQCRVHDNSDYLYRKVLYLVKPCFAKFESKIVRSHVHVSISKMADTPMLHGTIGIFKSKTVYSTGSTLSITHMVELDE